MNRNDREPNDLFLAIMLTVFWLALVAIVIIGLTRNQ